MLKKLNDSIRKAGLGICSAVIVALLADNAITAEAKEVVENPELAAEEIVVDVADESILEESQANQPRTGTEKVSPDQNTADETVLAEVGADINEVESDASNRETTWVELDSNANQDMASADSDLLDMKGATRDASNNNIDTSVAKEQPAETAEETDLPSLVINEIDSSPSDWVELANIAAEVLDISHYEIRDDSDDHRFKIAPGTELGAGEVYVITMDETEGLIYNDQTQEYEEGIASFGIGSNDMIRLYDPEGQLIDQFAWQGHAQFGGDVAMATWARYPSGLGNFYISKPTPGAENERHLVTVAINEIESSDPQGGSDWAEIYNYGDSLVDISGWVILDDKGTVRIEEKATTPVADGTVLMPGEIYVFEEDQDFTFGLGKQDTVTILDASGEVIDSHSWDGHASGSLQRIPNGTGEFRDVLDASKGELNTLGNPVIISEVESKDPDNGPDWIELFNPRRKELDISGLVLKDNKDENIYIIPEGTTIDPLSYFVIDQNDFSFGLGGNDAVRIFDGEELIQHVTWDGHAEHTWGRRPDNGEYGPTSRPTPGARNEFADIPNLIDWPGTDEIIILDQTPIFRSDSSGLDFYDGHLYAIDNGTGILWKLQVGEDGKLTFAEGFEEGKRVRFQKDADNPNAAGPDAEGVTLADNGLAYIAAERDNSDKATNFNVVLEVDPLADGPDLVALREWDLTALLPQVSANMGIEAIEWVANDKVNGKLFDQNSQAAYDSSQYTQAIADGVFFVALEDNGHVYAFVLNADETAQQISEIDPKIGGAMGLHYDNQTDILWVQADNGYNNLLAQIKLNGTDQPEVTHVNPPAGININDNNEGFAIADANYAVDGKRPVYWFQDGPKQGVLQIGYLNTEVMHQSSPELEADPTSASQTELTSSRPKVDADRPSYQVQGPTAVARVISQTKPLTTTNQSKSSQESTSSEGKLPQTGVVGESLLGVGISSILAGLGLAMRKED